MGCLVLRWLRPDLVDDEDWVSVPADPALQVGTADGELSGQFLQGNILQQGSGKADISTLGGFLEVENLNQGNRGEHEYQCQ